ncbi:MAG TPA: dihydrolipoyllysine-residue acetyltransferase [Candidatus Competibacteraceae bacterium]|nr:dihydrolipoyllysine-residue acetyltransferase [Candidatus Competibacteraceae bacterium]MCP5134580.1 dihydrolipoyllysine-residue acetyltransferase [Gammaproteobacteria bacterium]HPF58463.1 dihydrolipoyllysine-residue acetyltransferase [Candidatus Competibacteraceae bacterium]HRY17532.1 dihydrolipoyllysine-residue acetyltransferase [Candidatus Competibacteraceae bacterium]
MSIIKEIHVPDIGDFKGVDVIEVLVAAGDSVDVETPLIILETDKASMEVPSPLAGVIREVKVKAGSKVSQGDLILYLDVAESVSAPEHPSADTREATSTDGPGEVHEVRVPDIGDFKNIPVIEVLVAPGDHVDIDTPLITLESDKASMEVPSPYAGTVQTIETKVGDPVSQGDLILQLRTSVTDAAAKPQLPDTLSAITLGPRAPKAEGAPKPPPVATLSPPPAEAATAPGFAKIHASPSVRRFARELGVDLTRLAKGSGPKGRLLKEDVQAFVKGVMTGTPPAAASAGGVTGGGVLDLLPWPTVDFAKFGPVESKPLPRIKKLSGANLSRNWVMIPAVTYHEDADITDLEAFRIQINKENEKGGGIKLTMLAFMIKACVRAMQQFPEFNTSLDGDNLIYKQYFHIAFAADTPNGLVVPVIKDADKKGVFDIARETGELARKARDGKLGPAEMQGACFTISSVGGIGGTAFSPIINAPEVAILGASKSVMKPVWDGKQFVPHLILPLSLTADHRVIDGALATRFNVYLAQLLADFRRVML